VIRQFELSDNLRKQIFAKYRELLHFQVFSIQSWAVKLSHYCSGLLEV